MIGGRWSLGGWSDVARLKDSLIFDLMSRAGMPYQAENRGV